MNWVEIRKNNIRAWRKFKESDYYGLHKVNPHSERILYSFFDDNNLFVNLKYNKGKFIYRILNANNLEKNELWLPMIEYENDYEVSNLGRIKSIKRLKSKILKPAADRQGYLFVYVSKRSITKRKDIHREVAKGFCTNFTENLQVNHIDGIKTNNNINNLEAVTPAENVRHAVINGFLMGNKPAGFKTRTEAEEKAFERAFEILNKMEKG